MLLHKAMRELQAGQIIKVVATDPSTERDIPKFCQFLGHDLLNEAEHYDTASVAGETEGQVEFCYLIRKKQD